jgi:hypothetical protein
MFSSKISAIMLVVDLAVVVVIVIRVVLAFVVVETSEVVNIVVTEAGVVVLKFESSLTR